MTTTHAPLMQKLENIGKSEDELRQLNQTEMKQFIQETPSGHYVNEDKTFVIDVLQHIGCNMYVKRNATWFDAYDYEMDGSLHGHGFVTPQMLSLV